jgi:hypothetical protein
LIEFAQLVGRHFPQKIEMSKPAPQKVDLSVSLDDTYTHMVDLHSRRNLQKKRNSFIKSMESCRRKKRLSIIG